MKFSIMKECLIHQISEFTPDDEMLLARTPADTALKIQLMQSKHTVRHLYCHLS